MIIYELKSFSYVWPCQLSFDELNYLKDFYNTLMKIIRSKEFKPTKAWGALDIANMCGKK